MSDFENNENNVNTTGIYNDNTTEFQPIIEAAPAAYAEPVKANKKKEKNGAGILAAAIIISIVLSMAFGIGGGILTYTVMNKINPISIKENEINTDPKQITQNLYLSEESLNTAQIARTASPSVVAIYTESVQTSFFMQQYITEGAGSGVIFTEDGYIITNNHITENTRKITVELQNGEKYDAALIGSDSENDLSLIKIDATGLTPVSVGDSDELVVGQKAIAIGNPLGTLGGTVTEGIVSALDREMTIEGQQMTLLQTSAAINPGNSGGGLFDENANLIGVVNSKTAGMEIEGLGFAIPANTVKEVYENLKENGSTPVQGAVKLGITAITIDDEKTARSYGVKDYGVYIYSIEMASNASRAGLQPGDRIISVNDTNIETSDDIADIVSQANVGDNMTITYARDGVESTVSILLAAFDQ